MCRPKGYGFCAVLVWLLVYILPILVWNRVWFSRELRLRAWMCSSFQFQMNKKESVICQFEIDWNLSFFVPNLSNDDIISVYVNMYGAFCDHLHVWKQAWILEARSENGWSNRVRILRTGRHIPTKNSEEYPRAHYTLYGEKNEHGQFLNCLTSRWCFTKRGKEKFGRSFKWS